jgi:hypothetical protein
MILMGFLNKYVHELVTIDTIIPQVFIINGLLFKSSYCHEAMV